MAVDKLYLLPVGRCLVDQSALNTTRPTGKLVDLPIWAYLVETSDGPILIDTGMPDSCLHDPDHYFDGTEDEGLIVPKMSEQDRILAVLARCGYQPSDLLCVVSSHWHFDHAGGNRHFPDTPILVQRAEYDVAMHGEGYPDDCRIPGLNYQIIEGDCEVVPGFQLLFTPGHSPGHQSMLITTRQSGPVLLTVDAAYTRENFENGVPFAGVDPDRASQSLDRLRTLVHDCSPKLFFGHDPLQEREWPTFPAYL
jgi:N-acyl homoserine lactone hydrolase